MKKLLASRDERGPSTTDEIRCTWSPGLKQSLLCSRVPLPAHSPLGRAQDTARGQLGGSQAFGRQIHRAYQWALVRLRIPELLSHIFAGNYKSPCKAFCRARVLQYLALCNFASSANNRSAHFCSAWTRLSVYRLSVHKGFFQSPLNCFFFTKIMLLY